MSRSSFPTPRRADPVLTALQIPDAVPIPWDDDSTSLYGVGKAAINSGLAVLIESYDGMAVGDYLSVHWDDSGVPFASHLVEANDIGHHLVLKLDEALFAEGDFQPYYNLSRPSLLDVNSPARAIRVQLSTPGGEDPLPGTEHNENLAAPQVPEDLLLNGIDAEQAALGVDITLAAYPNMAEYDRVDFNWGGQRLNHTVQPQEVGNPLVLHIEEATILAAGDGVIALAYQVIDAAANRSDGWSVTSNVEVLASGTVLDAPLVPQAPNGELDLAGLAGADVRVQVVAHQAQFAVGESVELTWAGKTDAGLSVDWSDTLPVASLPQVLEFFVPNDIVAAIAQGSAVVSYTLHKLDGSDLPSKRVQIHVVGEIQTLPAPSVREASNGSLAANVEQATVDIAAYTGMAAGDLITLIWSGEKANGQPTDYRTERTVTGGMVGQTVTFGVPGAAQVAPLDGGQVTLWYQVSAAGVLQRALVQESERLQLSVGSAAATLPAPSVVEADNGALSPDVLQATVQIAPYTGMAAGDRVDLFWQGNLTGEFTDWLPITSTTVGHTLTFTVYPEHIAPNATAEVSYRVTRAAGGTEPSAVLQLRIGEAVPLPAPTIDQANGDQLDPADVPNGATVRVAASANLQAGDLLTVHWAGTAGAGSTDIDHPVTGSQAGKEVTVVVPFSVVEANEGNSIALSYDVLRVAGGSETSPVAVYEVQSATLPLPAPTIVEAQGNVLNPAYLLEGATARIDATAQLQANDLVTLHWVGLPGVGTYEIKHAVSSDQAGKTLDLLVPLSVAAANVGHDITLSYDVFRGGSTEVSAESIYQIKTQALVLPTPVIDEAQGNQLDPDDVPNGATVRILASANLKNGDILFLHWEGLPGGGTSNQIHTVTSVEVGRDITLVVPYAVVLADQDTTINLFYSATRGLETGMSPVASFDIGTVSIVLPAPTIDEAQGNELDLTDVPDGATVRIDASADLQAGDLVTVHWEGTPGTGSADIDHTVTSGEAGKDLTVVVPFSVVEANTGKSIELSYDVSRSQGGDSTSPTANYVVSNSAGIWTLVGSMHEPRVHFASALLSNGQVIVAGGQNNSATYSKTSEIYEPTSQAWIDLKTVHSYGISYPAMIHTTENRAMIISGLVQEEPLTKYFTYNGSNWTASEGGQDHARFRCALTKITDNKSLLTGGDIDRHFQAIYNIFIEQEPQIKLKTIDITDDVYHGATLLANGTVLISGGRTHYDSTSRNSCRIFDPISLTWSGASNLINARSKHTSTLTADNKLIVIGGLDESKPISTVELYDPTSNSWTELASLAKARYGHTANLLDNGNILVSGGIAFDGTPLASVEIYNPAKNTWTQGNDLNYARAYHIAERLPDGAILVAGGLGIGGDILSSTEIFLTSPTISTLKNHLDNPS